FGLVPSTIRQVADTREECRGPGAVRAAPAESPASGGRRKPAPQGKKERRDERRILRGGRLENLHAVVAAADGGRRRRGDRARLQVAQRALRLGRTAAGRAPSGRACARSEGPWQVGGRALLRRTLRRLCARRGSARGAGEAAPWRFARVFAGAQRGRCGL